MSRSVASALAIGVLALAIVGGPVSANTFWSTWTVARADLPGGGSVTSVLSWCEDVGGQFDSVADCGRDQSIRTQFKARPPGEVWHLALYRHGSCSIATNLELVLPTIRIGSMGRRSANIVVTGASFKAAQRAVRQWKGAALRISTPGYSACVRYSGFYGVGGA
jgi:hypothetical protein